MGNLVYDDTERLVTWASDIIGFTPRPDVRAIGWEENGELRAVTLYDGFSAADCNIHIAGDGKPHWFKRQFLVTSFMHPFVQWELRRVTGLVPSKNIKALKFDLNLGFVQEGVLRHAMPDDDVIILGMIKSECRFIPRKYRGIDNE